MYKGLMVPGRAVGRHKVLFLAFAVIVIAVSGAPGLGPVSASALLASPDWAEHRACCILLCMAWGNVRCSVFADLLN